MNNAEMIKLTNAHIPSGMCLSVDWNNNQSHPVGGNDRVSVQIESFIIKTTDNIKYKH